MLHCYNKACNLPIDENDEFCENCEYPQFMEGNFRFRDVLGSGGFAAVYDGFDLKMQRKCAIKEIVIRPIYVDRKHIKNEIDLLAQNASSLNFVPDIYNYWEARSKQYIAMQYFEGHRIDKLDGYWNSLTVEKFLIEMLQNLVRLHDCKITHRDIKPSNIILTKRRGYVLLDFGLATTDNTVIHGGTPDYAPIEQFYERRPLHSKIGPWSDLYSLGVTAYNLLTNSKVDRADIRIKKPQESSFSYPPNVAKELQTTLNWMLQVLPEQRPQSARDALRSLGISGSLEREFEHLASQHPLSLTRPGLQSEVSPHTESRILQAIPHRGCLNDIAWLGNSQQIVVASSIGSYVYDLTTSQPIDTRASQLPIKQIAYIDSKSEFVLSTEMGIQIGSFNSQSEPFTLLQSPKHSDYHMAISASHQRIAVVTDKDLLFWPDLRDAPITLLYQGLSGVIALSPSGEHVAVATHDHIQLWQLQQQKLNAAFTLTCQNEQIVDMCFAHDGDHLVFATDQAIYDWHGQGKPRLLSNDLGGPISAIALAQQGLALIAAIVGGRILLWNGVTRQLLPTLPDQHDVYNGVAFSPNGHYLAAFSQSELVVWSVHNSKQVGCWSEHLESLQCVEISPDGRSLAAMGGRIYLWQLESATTTPPRVFDNGQSYRQNGLAFDATSNHLISASFEGLWLWDVQQGRVLGTIPTQVNQARSVVFADETTFLNVGVDAVEQSSIEDATLTVHYPLDGGASVVLASGGRAFAILQDNLIKLVYDKVERYTITIREGEVNACALSPDGAWLAVATSKDTQLWQLQDVPRLCQQVDEWAQQVVLAPNAERVALLRNRDILLWDTRLGDIKSTSRLEGHTDLVTDVAFLPNGGLVSVSQDGTVRLWDHQIVEERSPDVDVQPEQSTPPKAPSTYLTKDIEELILRNDFERLWRAFANRKGGRYLLTGYGQFGGKSLLESAMRKAHSDLQQHHSDSALLALDFKVISDTHARFQATTQKLTMSLLTSADKKTEFIAYRPEPLDEIPLATKLDLMECGAIEQSVRSAARPYTSAQLSADIQALREGKPGITALQIIERFITSSNPLQQLIIVIDEINEYKSMEILSTMPLFHSDKVFVAVVMRKEVFDRWEHATYQLETLQFEKWYVPCLWDFNISDLLNQSLISALSESYNKLDMFRLYLTYVGRGSRKRIIDALESPQMTYYGNDNPYIDIDEVLGRSTVIRDICLQKMLDLNWDVILPKFLSSGALLERTDRAKIGVYYLLDDLSRGPVSYQQLLQTASKTPITIANSLGLIEETVYNLIYVLKKNKFITQRNGVYSMQTDFRQRNPEKIKRIPTNDLFKTAIDFDDDKLFQCIDAHFSIRDIKLLCDHLKIDDEHFPTAEKVSFIRELLKDARRKNYLNKLFDLCREERPHVDWSTVRVR